MSLPKLNTKVRFETFIPSTGQPISFRPFLAADEKAMLFAAESRDEQSIAKATIKLLEDCFDELPTSKLKTFDVEYLLIKLRSKSVGEFVEPSFECGECKTENTVAINVDTLVMTESTEPDLIKLTDEVSVKMQFPNFQDVLGSKHKKKEDPYATIRFCIHSVLTAEDQINFKEETLASQNEFLGSLNRDQMNKITKFIQAMPQIKAPVKFSCKKCEHVNDYEFTGLNNFFGS